MDQVMNQGLCRTPSLRSFICFETHVAIGHYKNDSLGGVGTPPKGILSQLKLKYFTQQISKSRPFKKSQ